MEHYWTNMRTRAEEIAGQDFSVAARPAFIITPPADRIVPHARLDMRGVVDHLVERGIDEEHLQALAICLVPGQPAGTLRGSIYLDPQVTQSGRVHYPWIDLYLPYRAAHMPAGRLERRLNKTLRHELRHVEQQNSDVPAYSQERPKTAMRLGSFGVAAACAAKFGYELPSGDTSLDGLHMIAASLGVVGTFWPRDLLYVLSPREIDARRSAADNPGFMPLRISPK